MRAFALLCLLPLLVSAQDAGAGRGAAGRGNPGSPTVTPPPPPPTPAQDLCSLEGQVFNAATGQPLRKANVNMNMTNVTPSTPQGPHSYSATTDAAGHFLISGIEPGAYRLNADHTGFLSMQYNARRPGGPGTSLDLARAQKMTGVAFRLTPHGVVSGHVVDEDGDPLEGVQIQLMRLVYNQGRKQLQVNDNSNTNDLGEFRVPGVVPGKYYLCATYHGRRFVQVFDNGMAMGAPATQPDQQDYVPTYYPGTTDIAAATPIEMKAGQQIEGLKLRLSKVHTVRVRGRVVNNAAAQPPPPAPAPGQGATPSGADALAAAQEALQSAVTRMQIAAGATNAATNMSLRMQPRNALNPQGLNVNARLRPDGTFEFASVAPGAYNLIVTANGNRGHSTRMPLDVGDANVDGVTIAINPGVSIVGHVHFDGDAPADAPQSFNIRLTPREPGIGGGALQPAKTGSDGTFRMDDVNTELYNVSVTPMPSDVYLKSIRAGSTDVMASGLDLSNGSAAPLDIVIGTNPPQIMGAVQNESTQQPAVAVTVVLIPQEKERKEQSTYYRTTTTDQYGKFTFTKVMPGEYRAYVFEDVENGAWYDPDFMKPIEGKGESVSVREGMPATLSLTMIPAGQ